MITRELKAFGGHTKATYLRKMRKSSEYIGLSSRLEAQLISEVKKRRLDQNTASMLPLILLCDSIGVRWYGSMIEGGR